VLAGEHSTHTAKLNKTPIINTPLMRANAKTTRRAMLARNSPEVKAFFARVEARRVWLESRHDIDGNVRMDRFRAMRGTHTGQVQTLLSLVVIGAILFLAAGDWRWPQAWIFLVEIGVSSFAVSTCYCAVIRCFLRLG
jgi:hypothetical protein